VQTFVPHPDLAASAAALDDRRLGKQRVETLQILRALHLEDYGWANHPAVTMWRGHALALVAYGLAICDEWIARGHTDATRAQIAEFALPASPTDWADLDPALLPPWWGREDVHASHRAALVRKDPEAYAGLAVEDPDMAYTWPAPPAPPADRPPFSAWLVRVDAAPAREALVELGIVALPAAHLLETATPKQRRQRALFSEQVEPGDPIALSDGAVLEVGEVAGLAVRDPSGGLARRVRFTDRLERGDLVRPWQLQDPRIVSTIRGEPAVLAASCATAALRR
jgi:hypothetical protein